MKKILFFSLMAATMFGFYSCDAIEDAIDDAKEAIDDYQDDQPATLTESADGLTLTLVYKKSGLGFNHEAKFEAKRDSAGPDTLCTSYIYKQTFALATAAKLAYDQIVEEYRNDTTAIRPNLSYDQDKTITIDNTAEFAGKKKWAVKLYFQTLEAGYKKGDEAINNAQGDSIK